MKQGEVLGPSRVFGALDAIAILVAQSFMLARQRLTDHISKAVRPMAVINNLRYQLALRDRELAVLRSRVEGMEPHKRPHYTGPMRQEILLLTRLNEAPRHALPPRVVSIYGAADLMVRPHRSAHLPGAENLPAGRDEQAVVAMATGAFRQGQEPYAREGHEPVGIVLETLVPGLAGSADTPNGLVAVWAAGVAAIVLLIALANVTNLFLVRVEERRGELEVRAALGAGVGTLGRYLAAEAIVMTGIAGLLALALAHWGVPAILSLAPEPSPAPRPSSSVRWEWRPRWPW